MIVTNRNKRVRYIIFVVYTLYPLVPTAHMYEPGENLVFVCLVLKILIFICAHNCECMALINGFIDYFAIFGMATNLLHNCTYKSY